MLRNLQPCSNGTIARWPDPLVVQGRGYPPFGGLPGPGVRSRTRRYGTWRLWVLRLVTHYIRKHMPV